MKEKEPILSPGHRGKLTLEFLGSGTSVGVPTIGCDCSVCTSDDPRNKRLRSSALVRHDQTTVLIDTGPDLRTQALRANLRRIDAAIVTHYHADHFVGIDELRRFNQLQHQVIDLYALPHTLNGLARTFGYIFSETLRPGLPNLRACSVMPGIPFQIGTILFEPLLLDHAIIETLGLSIATIDEPHKRIAYCLDCKIIPDAAMQRLIGVDVLILDMLREKEHLTHMNYHEAMNAVEKIKPAKTWFGHIAHEVDHAAFEARLPEDIRIAYDELIIEI